MADLAGAIITDPDEGALLGESSQDLHRAVVAGILVVCPVNDGTCPNGLHSGGTFLHFTEDMTYEDYDRCLL